MKDIPESAEWVRTALTVKCTKSGVIRCRVQKAVGTGVVYEKAIMMIPSGVLAYKIPHQNLSFQKVQVSILH